MGFKLWKGDCLTVMPGIPDRSVHLVLTDPPYSTGTRREGQKGVRTSASQRVKDREWFGSDSLTTNGFVWLMRACALEWKRLLVSGGHVLVFIDWRMVTALSGAIESADLRHAGLLVWDKVHFGLGTCFRNQHELILHFTNGLGTPPQRRDVGNVLAFKAVRNGTHPTEKPVELLERLIGAVAPVGSTVLDPFMGGGSCGVACLKTGRRFLGIEKEPNYFETAKGRLLEAYPRPFRPSSTP